MSDKTEKESKSAEERLLQIKARRAREKMVGTSEDLIPFAWRNPITPSKSKKK
ncbi:MAG: hypothetical protein FWH03_00465 [Firmicutes bacterium]|nr:hypothetical protein [Bacillota bacterium]